MVGVLLPTKKNLINDKLAVTDFKIFFTKEADNIKHHNTISVGINDEYSNAIPKPRNAFVAQQQ